MEKERCKITLNSPENIYFAGQQIKGKISLTLVKRTKVRGIKFRITGKGKCNWVELLRRESQALIPPNAKNPRSIIYSAKETYLIEEFYIFGSNNARPIELDPGEHTYDLIYELDKNLPSSFSGNYGSIKYKAKFIIEKPWTLNEKYTIPIVIVKSFLMPPPVVSSIPSEFFQVTKSVGVFGGGPISLAAGLAKKYVVRGGKLKLKVTVDNQSSTHVDRLKFSIKQIVTYFSEQPLYLRKDQITKLFKKETGGIQKKSVREYEHELQIPSCQPSDNDLSKIIHIKYEVQVEAILPGLYKNIVLSLPLCVCSAEFDAGSNIGWLGYPNPNVSIYSEQSIAGSPSHSMYSSDNQSTYSGYDSSFSDDSERLTVSTSTARTGSFRNSIGFELQQRITTTDGNFGIGTLNHQRNHSISNSNPSNYQQYCPELPPSYEELFGNATASPSTSSTSAPSAPPSSPPGSK